MKLTDKDIAEHELTHILCCALALQKYHPHLFAKASAEIEINAGGGHAIVLVGDDNAPSNVLRMMAMGPVLLGGIENLRGILRAKQIPLEGSKMSTADVSGMLRHGGPDLSIADCEILCAAAKAVHDIHWQDVVTAVANAKTLVLPLSQFFAPSMLSKALESSGNDYMKLHSRYDGLPEWCVKSVERRYNDAMAMSPAL
jgi:hypothetical protein